MSATSFLRHRRAVAVAYIVKNLNRRSEAKRQLVEELLTRHGLNPAEIADMSGNTLVLSIADELAALELGEPELDSLETIGAVEVGDRAAVHSPDVRADQFEDQLQHPTAETVGVGNMHDGPAAAEDLANVSAIEVEEAGGLAAAAAAKADRDPLADHDLPPDAPSMEPAAEAPAAPAAGEETAAEAPAEGQDKGAKPEPEVAAAEASAETIVDVASAAEELAAQEKDAEKLERLGKAALENMDRRALIAYAEKREIQLTNIKSNTAASTIRKQIYAAEGQDKDEG